MKLAFLGLGVMGYPMAGHLVRAGHDVTVFNRTSAKAEAWVGEYGGQAAPTVSEAVVGAQIAFLCVGADDDVRQVAGEALAAGREGLLVVDHTTASAKIAREMAEAASNGRKAFLDAPVSGGQAGAQNGALTVMCGGAEADFARAEPVMQAYGKTIRLIGPAGSGQLAKMVNQVCIAGVVQGIAEGMHFAKSAGLDPTLVYEAISKGAAQSWQMDNRWASMDRGEYEFGFATDWMRKDLGLVLDEARRNGAHMAMTALVDQFYSEVQSLGGGRWDSSSLHARLEDRRK